VSEVSDAATARLLIADYAGADPIGKINVVGGLVTVLGLNPAIQGMTAPFWLTVWVNVPSAHYNAAGTIEVVLEDASGEPVSVTNPTGEAAVMQIEQRVTFRPPTSGPMTIPAELELPSRTTWVSSFPAGLPLAVGARYRWRVKIDGESRDEWTEDFVVTPAAFASPSTDRPQT
jgi:hypothetical protein